MYICMYVYIYIFVFSVKFVVFMYKNWVVNNWYCWCYLGKRRYFFDEFEIGDWWMIYVELLLVLVFWWYCCRYDKVIKSVMM